METRTDADGDADGDANGCAGGDKDEADNRDQTNSKMGVGGGGKARNRWRLKCISLLWEQALPRIELNDAPRNKYF